MSELIDAICIDDRPDFRRKHAGILKLLASMGKLGRVVEAESVEEALNLITAPDSDLNIGTGIIDYNLGVDPTTGRLRQTGLDFITFMHLYNPQTSFVLATADDGIKQLGEMVERMRGYAVPKTIRPMELAERVQRAIQNYRAHSGPVERREYGTRLD